MTPIVDADWLRERIDDVVVVCVGTTMTGGDPRDSFVRSHVAGARFMSLDDDLAAPAASVAGRHPLPSPTAFASALGAIGIDEETVVVAYDDRGGAFASRLVWMLRIIGQEAALLDGGLTTWDGPTSTGDEPTGAAADLAVERRVIEWPADAMADSDDVVAHVEAGGTVIDSREAPRYRGEVEPIDTVAGHVSGAINVPFADNLVDGRFRSAGELRERFAAVDGDPDAIVYCGSGVTACHNALAIEAAGYPRPRVYVGSWSGWSTEPGRPIATG